MSFSQIIAGSLTEGMRINSTGVGIGTTAPAYELDISSADPQIGLTDTNGSTWYLMSQSDAFWVKDVTNSETRLYINSAGKVGIGTYSPQKALEISAAGTSGGGVMRLASTGETSAGDAAGTIQFYNGDTTDHTPGVFGIIRGVAGPSGGEGHLQFLTDMPSEGADASTVAMQIHSNANVGIGTTSPFFAKLPVVGRPSVTSLILSIPFIILLTAIFCP